MNDLEKYSDLLKGDVKPMDLGGAGVNQSTRSQYVYLVAVSNELLRRGAITTFTVASTRPYTFTANDFDTTTCMAQMQDFKAACRDYLCVRVNDSRLLDYFVGNTAVLTQVIAVSRLST